MVECVRNSNLITAVVGDYIVKSSVAALVHVLEIPEYFSNYDYTVSYSN